MKRLNGSVSFSTASDKDKIVPSVAELLPE